MTESSAKRLRCRKLLSRVCSAEEAARLIKRGMTVGTSGFTPAGYPKAVPMALAERVRGTGERLDLTLITGASVGEELDGAWSEPGILRKRLPYQTNDSMRSQINCGNILFIDDHLSQVAARCRRGFYGTLDLAIVEAVLITEDGGIVPSTSVGNSPTFVKHAREVIVEINTSQPLELMGFHDIYFPEDPPYSQPIPLTQPAQRIGTTFIPCDPDKIKAVVFTDIPDNPRPLAPADERTRAIASHVLSFLESQVKAGRLPPGLLPLQSGVGNIANAVLYGLLESRYRNLAFYSEVIQDAALDLIDAGRFSIVSGTSLSLSPDRLRQFYDRIACYRDKLILRPQEVSNHPEVIRRLGIVAMNTALEIDIYGNVNSTHVLGSSMMNGIGGSGDFSRNAYLTIFMAPSVAKDGRISTIVPMVSHVDHTEHEVHVVVTEHGFADLRGLAPRERARLIIKNCAHPDFRPALMDYYERAEKLGGHTPHILKEALAWHVKFMETGSMK